MIRALAPLSAFAICAALCGVAYAAYPERTVHIVVGAEPGGGTDLIARLIAKELATKWGQSVVVDNRAGADSIIAEDYTAHSAPDGYTIQVTSNNHTITPGEYKLNYDPIKSFAPISQLATVPDVLVINPTALPAKDAKEMIALVKASPGKYSYGSGGGSPYLETAVMMGLTGMQMERVNFKSTAPAMVSLLGGEVQVMFGSVTAVQGQVTAGKLRALAVSTNVRSAKMPDVPTLAEAADLPDYNVSQWYGVIAPSGVPKPILDKLHDDIVEALHKPDVQARMAEEGFISVGNSSEVFAKMIATDIPKYAAILKSKDAK